jgi:hypothetical protein
VPGTLSWLDPNDNKAFLDGQVSVTNNGISIYYAAKNSQDPKVKVIYVLMRGGPLNATHLMATLSFQRTA